MKKLIVYYGQSPECIQGFPVGCRRSVRGALHLLPRVPVTVTSDEFDYLSTVYSQLLKDIRVIAHKPMEPEDEKAKEEEPEARKDAPKEDATKKASSTRTWNIRSVFKP